MRANVSLASLHAPCVLTSTDGPEAGVAGEEVNLARPHPNPLPQERGNLTQRWEQTDAPNFGRPAGKMRVATRQTPAILKLNKDRLWPRT